MAKITTVTNPLTGQPAQVDQLDHTAQQIDDAVTRAIGYGLGGNSKNVTDWNNEKTNGWVRDDSGTEDKHSPFVGLFSVGLISDYSSGNDTFQLAFARNQYEKTRTYIKFRAYNGDKGVWGEWEWVNPPMELGVEYRTTERYLGKPVYAKIVSFGSLPQNSYKNLEHGIENVGLMLSCRSTLYDNSGDSNTIPFYQTSITGHAIEVFATKTIIRAVTNYDVNQSNEMYCLLKYTKTTD